MNSKERKQVVRRLIKLINDQVPSIDAIVINTMTVDQQATFKKGLKCGIHIAINVLKDEL